MAHMHYKGTGKIHSFRGRLTDVDGGNQDKISIQGSVGSIAWRITKFKIMSAAPGVTAAEYTVKIFREVQSSITGLIDFRDNELLAAATLKVQTTLSSPESALEVIFDNALFVRDIYVTNFDADSSADVNYYIELEEVKVGATGMAQLAVAAARRTATR